MLRALLSRELSSVDAVARRRTSRLSLAADFSCLESDLRQIRSPLTGNTVPPFSSAFARQALRGEGVVVSDEEGYVTLFDTSVGGDGGCSWSASGYNEASVVHKWRAHDNAVFDVAWVHGDEQLLTCSGDQTSRLWDVATQTRRQHALGRAAQESEIPSFKVSDLCHFPLVSADFWTSDHLSERSRSVDVFPVTRARGTLTLKRR